MACSTPADSFHKTEIEDTLSEVVCKFWGARGGGGGGDAVTTVSVYQPEQIDVQPPGLGLNVNLVAGRGCRKKMERLKLVGPP